MSSPGPGAGVAAGNTLGSVAACQPSKLFVRQCPLRGLRGRVRHALRACGGVRGRGGGRRGRRRRGGVRAIGRVAVPHPPR